MASRALEMSLDDVAKERNSTRPARGGRRSTGGGSGPAARTPYERPSAPAGKSSNDAWTHDLYGSKSTSGPRRSFGAPGGASTGSTRILVTNVHYEVTQADLKNIFGRVGKIVEGPTIRFDRSGRSTGIVSVEYETHQEARAAINSFDGQLAKGQALSIRFDDARPAKRAQPELLSRISGVSMPKPETRSSAPPNRGAPRGAPRGTPRGASRGGRGAPNAPRGERRPQKTAQDLDKELEAFVGGSKTETPAAAPAPAIAQPTGLGNDDIEMS